eukprot:TRINITY_DN2482_c0_g1_i3.p1 TRINITY_DN2482_c0_g1~~TRINITY_DN2482_c0_g1_i3.p1  ORF type:complete len:461 (+),score=122.16 TRINITY_DN2482_c0_g1_i3:1506-2888(+)
MSFPKFAKLLSSLDFESVHSSSKMYNGENLFMMGSSSVNTIYVRGNDLIKQIAMKKEFDKPIELYYPLDFLGRNVVVSKGEEWKKHRRICNPSFSKSNLELVSTTTKKYTEQLFNIWDKLIKEGRDLIEVEDYMIKLTLSIIGVAAFGRNMDDIWEGKTESLNENRLSFTDSINEVTKNAHFYVGIPHLISKNLPNFKRMHQGYNDFYWYLDNTIEEAYKTFSSNENSETEVPKKDLISLLIKSNLSDEVALTKAEIRSNSFIFMFAGHETTAHSLSFALSFLSFHPEVQSKVVEEYKRIIGDKKTIEYEDIKQMDYTRDVFYETLRLIPPVVGIPKKTEQDVMLGDKYFVKKDTYIVLDVANLHRNENYWEKPDDFYPERFSEHKIHEHAFAPFSLGSRSCIGTNFALIESVLILSLFVNKYILSPVEGTNEPSLKTCTSFLTTTPLKPIKFKVEPRNN